MSDGGKLYSELGPYAIVPEWVLDADVSDRAVRLYARLARYATRDGKAFPSRRTMSERLRCSLDSIDRAMRELVAIGALEKTARYREGTRSRTSNDYVLRAVPSRTRAATRGRTDAAGVAAPVRHHEREKTNEDRERSNDLSREGGVKELVDALELEGVTLPRAKSPRAAAMKLIRELEAIGATPESIAQASKAYRAHALLGARGIPITVPALVKWYDALIAPPRAAAPRREAAERFVRQVGFEYGEPALRDELGRFKLEAGDVEWLVGLAVAVAFEREQGAA